MVFQLTDLLFDDIKACKTVSLNYQLSTKCKFEMCSISMVGHVWSS